MIKKIIISTLLFFSVNAFSNTIEFVVSSAPGSSQDTVVRKVAKDLQLSTGLDIIVVNKPGASHNIAYQYVATATRPVMILTQDNIVTNKDKPGYPENIASLVDPLFYFGDFSNAMLINSNAPFKTVQELVEISKTRDIKIGHGGIGTYGHQSAQIACKHIFRSCLDVPYKSGGGAFLDLLNGTIDVFIPVTYGLGDILQNSGYKGLMVFSNTPHPALNIAPLPQEYSHLEHFGWLMLFQRNLSDEDKAAIIKALKSHGPKYYTSFGLWYRYKQPKEIWSKYANPS